MTIKSAVETALFIAYLGTLVIIFTGAPPAHAGFPVVYDPARGTPTQLELSVPIKFTGTERCTGTRRAAKITLTGEIILSALPMPKLTGTDAAKGLDFHEIPVGDSAVVELSNATRHYSRTFYESAGATIQATPRRVSDYFSGLVSGGYDKLYGVVIYDYPRKLPAKSISKFAIPGAVRQVVAFRPDTYHHLFGGAWLTSDDGVCRIHGQYKQLRRAH